ncbi:MAG: flagellar biosynthesis protein FlhB [Porticoccaceae bacterium]|nr:flagellar biosynthesis protein FlhB [Porticoccaceae bacterium]
MAESETGQERSEQPTNKRLEESRKKGQVPRSKELNTLLSLLFGATGLIFLGGHLVVGLTDILTTGLIVTPLEMESPIVLSVNLGSALKQALWLLVPLFSLLTIGAFVGPLVMGGWAFSTSAMAFKIEKVDPLKGMKRIFSAKSLMELIKAVAKFLLVATVTVAVISALFDQFLSLGSQNIDSSLAHLGYLVGRAFLGFCLALVLIAALDIPFQLWDHSKQMRMTLQEVKDEMKETEGRPEVKDRIRSLQRERSQQRMFEQLPEATVVITNPTHYAVALKYDEKSPRAPVVIAKGRDLVAARIRDIASEHNITTFSAPPLARAIYASTEIDQEIPAQLYLAVAQVLAYVYQLEHSLKVTDPKPKPPVNLPVPDDLARGLN